MIKITWKIGGEAGFGIKSAGLLFARTCAMFGYQVFDYTEYPSLVRGGHNTYQATVSDQTVSSVEKGVDILIALNQETVDKHIKELKKGGVIIGDGKKISLNKNNDNIYFVNIPLSDIVKEIGGNEIIKNMITIGASLCLLGLPPQKIKKSLEAVFSNKPDIIEDNFIAIKKGYQYIKNNYSDLKLNFSLKDKQDNKSDAVFLSGNEAFCLGAMSAGINFFAAYPMTPAASILKYFTHLPEESGVIVKQTEDEISAINMIIGASYAGSRAMTATSGGGFALMNEALGLSSMAEIPIVIVNAQRPGPATGMPTWTEQGDLQFVLHSSQGEFPRIILAPGDIKECFYQAMEAFNLADKYQLPVIILLDKFLSEGAGTADSFVKNKIKIDRGKILKESQIGAGYKRYEFAGDGISPRTLPGAVKGIYLANSDEHDEFGYSSDDSQNRILQMEKRNKKIESAAKELKGLNIYGNGNSEVALVSWGSTKGPLLAAVNLLPDNIADKIDILHFNVIWPFPSKEVKEFLSSKKKIILIESNFAGQLGQLITQETNINIQDKILKYNGRPFFPEDLSAEILKIL